MATSHSNEVLIGWANTLGLDGIAAQMTAATQSEVLTPLAMFMDADWIVKGVMLALLAASVACWAIWLGKLIQIGLANRQMARDFKKLSDHGRLGAELGRGPVAIMQAAAMLERQASVNLPPAGIKERCALDLTRIEVGAARAMQSGATIIGSIGSTAPFIGLFGTVWGIMNAFISISQSGTTNLSVVAPGIAEALLATAIGLVAAIPAVILYNHLTRTIGGYRTRLADAAALTLKTLSRDLDRDACGTQPDLRLAAE